jgi:hypothetical protein
VSVDLVWVVGGPGDREDLRYSLRSVTANLHAPYRDVWVVGDPPAWFTGARMPLEPHPAKFENQRRSLTAYVNHPDAAERFVLFNDDMFLLEPVDVLPVCRAHTQTGMQYAADHRENSSSRDLCVPDCYQCAVGETAAWTAEQLDGDTLLYESHTPLTFDTAKLREVLAAYPPGRPFAVGEVYPITGAGGPGKLLGNAKSRVAGSFTAKLALPMPYLSCSPQTWLDPVGPHIKGMFPDPCCYENDQTLEVAA